MCHPVIFNVSFKPLEICLAVTWMNLESVILSEVSQTEEKYHINPLNVESKMLQMKLHTKQKEIHRFRE